MKRICKVCGQEFELKPDHKGLATMCSPACRDPEKPLRVWYGGVEWVAVRSFTITTMEEGLRTEYEIAEIATTWTEPEVAGGHDESSNHV